MDKMVNGTLVKMTTVEKEEILIEWAANQKKKDDSMYMRSRQNEYPSIVDQLDMLYKDQINNTTLWRDLISNIKMKYPAPGK